MSDTAYVPRRELVELIADTLRYPGTELLERTSSWRHEDGQPLTPAETELLGTATLGEVRAALDVCIAESEAFLGFHRAT
jgi:hypothetical protein